MQSQQYKQIEACINTKRALHFQCLEGKFDIARVIAEGVALGLVLYKGEMFSCLYVNENNYNGYEPNIKITANNITIDDLEFTGGEQDARFAQFAEWLTQTYKCLVSDDDARNVTAVYYHDYSQNMAPSDKKLENLFRQDRLFFKPLRGGFMFNEEKIAAAIEAIGCSFKASSGVYFICENDSDEFYKVRDSVINADHYHLLKVVVGPNFVDLWLKDDSHFLKLGRNLIKWLRANYSCSVADKNGADLTEYLA